jgi:hypothetical protein
MRTRPPVLVKNPIGPTPLLVLRRTDKERERDLRWRVGRLCT